jgi:hypothetical protein
MTEIGPWMIAAHTKEQAEYVARSRAEQQGCDVSDVEVSGGASEMWRAKVTVTDATMPSENIADDGQVMRLDPTGG